MTIQTHSDANAFRAGAQATGRADHPWHAPHHDRPARSAAEVPASTLHWLVEALVLGPDRPMGEREARMADTVVSPPAAQHEGFARP